MRASASTPSGSAGERRRGLVLGAGEDRGRGGRRPAGDSLPHPRAMLGQVGQHPGREVGVVALDVRGHELRRQLLARVDAEERYHIADQRRCAVDDGARGGIGLQ